MENNKGKTLNVMFKKYFPFAKLSLETHKYIISKASEIFEIRTHFTVVFNTHTEINMHILDIVLCKHIVISLTNLIPKDWFFIS